MSTPLVVSVTDELVAELEAHYSGITDPLEFGDGTVRSSKTIMALIAERAELLRDAGRYRWLRDKSINAEGVFPMVSMTDDIGDQVSNWLFGKAVDDAIDAAMQSEAKP